MIDRDTTPSAQNRQADLICALRAGAQGLDRKHAIALAAGILHDILEDGITAADIMEPSAADRHVRQARTALNKISY